MKKLLTILAVLTLSFSLVACNNNENKDNNKPPVENVVPGGDVEQGGELDENDPGVPEVPEVSAEMHDLVTALVGSVAEDKMFMGMEAVITKDTATTDLGLTAEQFEAMIADSVKYDPPMIPAFHSLSVVKVKEGQDVATVKDLIFNNINHRKWVCTGAEKVLVADSGNYIMLVLSTPDLCTDLYEGLKTKFGAENVGEALQRDGEPPYEEFVDEL